MALRYTEEEHEEIQREFVRLFKVDEDKMELAKKHKFEGVVFNGITPPKSLIEIKDWETREDDIFVTTYPKSGRLYCCHWALFSIFVS